MAVGNQGISVYGPPPGAPGIRVIQQGGTNSLTSPLLGRVAFVAVLKRGIVGVPFPVTSRSVYDQLCGDPSNIIWPLYVDGSHLGPDAIDGFFNMAGGAGQLWLIRPALDGSETKAKVTLKNRAGTEVLKLEAANEGAWGGAYAKVEPTPVLNATAVTFTVDQPGILANQYMGAIARFSGKTTSYTVVANTASDPITNLAVFTIGSQYSLLADGIAGPTSISGTSSYSRHTFVAGTISCPMQVDVPGTVVFNNTDTTLIGSGTVFTNLSIGQNIYHLGEAHVVTSITSDTTLTIDSPFSIAGNAVTIQQDNLVVTGSNTTFTSSLKDGDMLYYVSNNLVYGRKVATIASDTALSLTSSFPINIPSGSQVLSDNLWVTGDNNTKYAQELSVGTSVVDPSQQNETVTVTAIDTSSSVKRFSVNKPFVQDFVNASLVQQSLEATVLLQPPTSTGLSVSVGLGQKYPTTHFSLDVYFNKSKVLTVPDASLDPNDPYFVETAVNNENIAYRDGLKVYQVWVTASSLCDSAYTTAQSNDVRPFNGAGTVLAVNARQMFSVDDFDYSLAIGSTLYPNPYTNPRSFLRIKGAKAPELLQGTVSVSGVQVNGSATNFTQAFQPGDFFYDPLSKSVQKVRLVQSDTAMVLQAAFPNNLPAGTTGAKKAGYIQVDQGIDLTKISRVGDNFMTSYREYFTGGYDGDTSMMKPYYFTQYLSPDDSLLENSVWGLNVGLMRIACPGISDVTVQRQGVAYANAKAWEYRVEVPTSITNAIDAVNFVSDQLGVYGCSVAFPSYGLISNFAGAGQRMVPLTGDIMGLESAYSWSNGGYHVAVAGVKAQLVRVLNLATKLNPTDEASLNTAGIQSIKFLQGAAVIWGARGPSLDDTYSFLNVSRTQKNYIRLFLESTALNQLLFSPNQPGIIDQISLLMESFARKEYANHVYNEFLGFSSAVTIKVTNASSTGGDVMYSYVPAGVLEKVYVQIGPNVVVASSQSKNTGV